jgi:hypothetical protein
LSLDVLLGGALGALIVFVFGVLLEWRRRERERRGLLRLLLAEINHNEIVIKSIDESGSSLLASPHLDKLKTETWDESRQAASGLPAELLNDPVNYYQPLEIFRTIRSLPPADPNRPPQDWFENLARAFDPLVDAVNELFGLPKTKHWRESYEQKTENASRTSSRQEAYRGLPQPPLVGFAIPTGGAVGATLAPEAVPKYITHGPETGNRSAVGGFSRGRRLSLAGCMCVRLGQPTESGPRVLSSR